MEKNYTPLHIDSLYSKNKENQKENAFEGLPNTIFLILATLTVLTISIVLFLLIQKNIKPQSTNILQIPVNSPGKIFYG